MLKRYLHSQMSIICLSPLRENGEQLNEELPNEQWCLLPFLVNKSASWFSAWDIFTQLWCKEAAAGFYSVSCPFWCDTFICFLPLLLSLLWFRAGLHLIPKPWGHTDEPWGIWSVYWDRGRSFSLSLLQWFQSAASGTSESYSIEADGFFRALMWWIDSSPAL